MKASVVNRRGDICAQPVESHFRESAESYLLLVTDEWISGLQKSGDLSGLC